MANKRPIGAHMWCYETCDHQGWISQGTKDEVAKPKNVKIEILYWK